MLRFLVSLTVGTLCMAGCATSLPDGMHQDANGRYTISTVPKVAGRFERINRETIRVYPFAIYRIASEDRENFYVKQYVPVEQPSARSRMQRPMQMTTPLPTTTRVAFAETGSGLPRNGQWREAFAVADMNGDGRPDIVLAPARKTLTPPVIFLNNGDGSFQRWTKTQFPQLPFDYGGVSVADFNGDGHADIAIASHLVGIAVLLGDSQGRFKAFNEGLPAMKAGERAAGSFSAKAIRAIDWDDDGRVDLVVQQEPGGGAALTTRPDNLVVFLNKRGRWQLLDAGTGETIPGDRIAIADLDGDGRPDAILGSAVLGDKRLGRMNRGTATDVLELSELPDGTSIEALAAGDVTGDGRPDVVVSMTAWDGARWISGIDVLVNEGGRFAQRPLWREWTSEPVSAMSIVDLDGDGRMDIVALRRNGGLLSFVADGRGFFTQDATMPAPGWRAGCSGIDIQPIAIGAAATGTTLVASFSYETSAMEIPPRCRNEGGLALIAVRRPD